MGQTRDGKAVAPLPSATAVTEPGMDRAPSDEQREERCVNPLLGGVLVWAVQDKRSGVQPYVFLTLWFSLFSVPMTWLVAPIPDAGPATDGRAATRYLLCINVEIPAKWITRREHSTR